MSVGAKEESSFDAALGSRDERYRIRSLAWSKIFCSFSNEDEFPFLTFLFCSVYARSFIVMIDVRMEYD